MKYPDTMPLPYQTLEGYGYRDTPRDRTPRTLWACYQPLNTDDRNVIAVVDYDVRTYAERRGRVARRR